MHELSIVESIIFTVTHAAREEYSHDARVERVTLGIGELSAVEMPALNFAWQHATPGSALQGCELSCTSIQGIARCRLCHREYHAPAYYTPCPECANVGNDIMEGTDVIIKSITLRTTAESTP